MPTIAIIHHERNILTALRMAFEAEGFTVRPYASTGEAAGLLENPPDLYILPRRSAPLSGVAFFRRIREHGNVPVVFLTANPDIVQDDLAVTGLEPEAHIEMPFSQRQVVKMVRDLLG